MTATGCTGSSPAAGATGPAAPTHPTGYDFELDDFQRRAIAAIDEGQSVLVAAPTGSGKTVVAEHAVADALARGAKAFYTTPIKALSNQKYADFCRRYGSERVGLLTGDTNRNGEAPVVVMTTEVLRNMIYAASPTLDGLRYVVLDEVHYLQNAYRGPVWEEVIIHLAPEVRLVCLSATVSNAEELSHWITTVRGPTAAVIEERRPVVLHNLYLVGDRTSQRLHLLPTLVDGRPNPEAARLDCGAGRAPGARHESRRPGRRLFTPKRYEVVERLEDEGMLPAISFIFSRVGCDQAVRQCLDAGLRLTTSEERNRIRSICEERTAGLSDDDLGVLGWPAWMAGMEAGLASHHAGMVPPFKEAVEACFAAGLVKVVFATETLALGINMPARAVVIEKLSKFGGERHQMLTPGEYTQLTGRAGRRGIDEVGYAVVLWSPFVSFDQVAALVSTRTFAISSSFRPTYNMAANLVHRYSAGEAHHLLNLSFAQYQADQEVVAMETRLERAERRLAASRAELACDQGDVTELLELQRRLDQRRTERPVRRHDLEEALAHLRPGDVVRVPGGKSAGPAVVLSATTRRGGIQLRVLTPKRRRLTLDSSDFDEPPDRLGRVELPRPYQPNSNGFQRQVATSLSRARLANPRRRERHRDPEVDEMALAVDRHPAAACTDLSRHRRAWGQVERLEREVARIKRQVKGRTATLARQFDRVLSVLEDAGYVDGWSLTERGARLGRIYHECDLLIAESLHEGVFDGLSPGALAGVASVFTFEARGRAEPPAPDIPSTDVRRRWGTIQRLSARLAAAEDRAGLPPTREPDPGFMGLAAAWAAGDPLDDVLEAEELSGGDFVRNVKQLIDLLRQLGEVAPLPATATAARSAADSLFRGVVEASSRVTAADVPAEQALPPSR
ncbi:MAG TPA: DEAD/DEAH box helicase [Acidimicrobiales bacterium]|nr:DEAD/DEAH box helicase [Acidimicrobiales bacterium]